MTRVLVVLVALFCLAASAQANLTINRYVNVDVSVAGGGFHTSTLNWTNNGFTNLNSVSVQMVLSSQPDDPFVVGDTDATLSYNIGETNQVAGAVIYATNPSDDRTSLNEIFVITNAFTSPGVNNEWSVDLFNEPGNAAAIFNYWRLILTGGAVTNGTIEAGAQGIISGTDGYTVTATISAGSGTGSNAVTAFVTNNQSLHFNGGVTGSGELAKTGAGTLTIGGASSGFTGTLNVEQGTAALTGAGTLATGTSINLSGSSSVFDISGMTAAGSTNGSLAGVSGSSLVLGGKHLTIGGNNANTSFAGVISGSGGSFTKTGTGTLTLSGANTFTGALTVAEGKLNISTINNANAAGVLGNSTNAVVLGSSGQTGFLHYIGTANASSDKTFTAASGGTAGIEVSNAPTTLTLSGAIGGSGNVQKGGAGILHLTGNNTFGGTLSVHDGTLQIGTINNANTAGVLGESANAVELGKSGTANVATLRYTGNSASSTKAFALVSTSSVAAVIDITNSAADLALSGVISGTSGLTKTGQGTLTLSGNNTFGGVLTVAEGKLTISTINDASENGVLGNSANAVILGSSGQTGFLHYTGGKDGSTKRFTAAAGGTAGIEVSNAATTLTLAGVIDGSGDVQKGGAGTLLLDAVNTFTGALNVHDGTLEVQTVNNASQNGTLGNSTHAVGLGKTNTSNTATFLYTGTTNASTTKGFTLNSQTNGAGVINVSSNNVALTVSGAIGGAGRLEKSGAGTLVLSASNNYSGGTTLSAGTLRVNQTHALGSGQLSQTSGSSLLQIGTTGTIANSMSLYNVQFSANATLTGAKTLNNATYTVDSGITATEQGVLGGSGGLTKSGAGTLVLSASNNYSGGTTLSAGTLRVNQTHALGSGQLSQTSGSSLLQIGTTGTIANSMSLYNVEFSANATLTGAKTLNNATYTVDSGITATEQGVLSGSGGLTKSGAGALVLHGSANNTYTGATVVNAGSLVLSNSSGNAINSSSSITVNSGGTLELGASNQIGNSIGLVLNGGTFLIGASGVTETLGTLTLSADSTIDFGNYGSTLRQLTFASSAGVSWATNATLTIANWQGVARTSSEITEIFFGVGGLNTGQLAQIRFANQNITGGLLLGSGELVPVPEPRVYAAAVALLAVVGWRERRRLVGFLRRR